MERKILYNQERYYVKKKLYECVHFVMGRGIFYSPLSHLWDFVRSRSKLLLCVDNVFIKIKKNSIKKQVSKSMQSWYKKSRIIKITSEDDRPLLFKIQNILFTRAHDCTVHKNKYKWILSVSMLYICCLYFNKFANWIAEHEKTLKKMRSYF